MYQPYSTRPLRPAAPKPVLAAAKFVYGGAAVSAAYLIAALPLMGGIHGEVLGHRLTATPLTTTVVVVLGLVPVALWLWMARQSARAGTGRASCPLCCSPWRRRSAPSEFRRHFLRRSGAVWPAGDGAARILAFSPRHPEGYGHE
jgi:hypothetical protein